MEKFHVPPDLDSLIVIEDEHLYTHSSGIATPLVVPCLTMFVVWCRGVCCERSAQWSRREES
jgi:hypothetical protein